MRVIKLNRADSNDIIFNNLNPNVSCLQAEARRAKVKDARRRREERQALKKEEMLKADGDEKAPAKK